MGGSYLTLATQLPLNAFLMMHRLYASDGEVYCCDGKPMRKWRFEKNLTETSAFYSQFFGFYAYQPVVHSTSFLFN